MTAGPFDGSDRGVGAGSAVGTGRTPMPAACADTRGDAGADAGVRMGADVGTPPGADARARRCTDGGADAVVDAGNAVVEFLGASLLLLVPVLYLVVVLAQLQAATFAADGAAREAARAMVTAASPDEGVRRAHAAVDLALADQSLDRSSASLAVTCSAQGCSTAGSTVGVRVDLVVDLPGVPRVLSHALPVRVPVSATVTAPVDTFRPSGPRP